MANIETLDLSEHPSNADGVNGVQEGSGVQGSSAKSTDAAILLSKVDDASGSDSVPASPSPGSGSVPLRAINSNGLTPGATNVPTLSMPHPKKFTHVNINKKFLEKTSSGSGSGPTLSSSIVTKVGTTAQKPTLQTTPAHSRLVTAKLTAGPQPSTVTGPGWSRPSSTGSTTTPTPLSANNTKPSPLPVPGSSHPPLQPPPAGKIIQPQPRGLVELSSGSIKKDGSSKPAWGIAKFSASVLGNVDEVQNEFPTAAEVAQVRTAKLNEKKQAAQAEAAKKQAVAAEMAAEADAFRGVHLAPNVHHWDEDEEDDDDFLGGVIEFGDGKQYEVKQAEPQQSSPSRDLPDFSTDIAGGPSGHPVSKEERFADDFDRSWPRSRGSNTFPHSHREPFPHGPPSSTSSQSMHSPQESSRVLFNERSNRLEPYSHSNRYGGPPRDPYVSRRDGRSDHTASPTESRNGRDLPPHAQRQSVQLLQKSTHGNDTDFDGLSRSRVFGDRHMPRQDHGPQSHMTRTTSQGSERSRDHYNLFGLPHLPPSAGPGRGEERTRRTSTTGPPPLPLPVETPREDGRQLPPHLSSLHPPPPPRRSPSSDHQPPSEPSSAIGPPSAHPITQSPIASHASISPLMSESALAAASTMPVLDIDEVQKVRMHDAAERARLRRQHEEEERERERERARGKAAEMEAKMKAADEEKARRKAEQEKSDTDAQVIGIIEEAVQSATASLPNGVHLETVPEESTSQVLPPTKPAFARTTSVKGAPRQRRTSFPTPNASTETPSAVNEVDSWRSKAAPHRPVVYPQPHADQPPTASTLPAPPLMYPQVEHLTIAADEDVEVVDFSELGKLVGAQVIETQPDEQPSERMHEVPSRPPRPVATDFFEDRGVSSHNGYPSRTEEASWRRKSSTGTEYPSVTEEYDDSTSTSMKEKPKLQITPAPPSSSYRRLSIPSEDHVRPHFVANHNGNVPPNHQPKSPLTPSYREAPMSALDDTMARIRGALDGMQKPEPPKPQARWIPPALRPRPLIHDDNIPSEEFDVTSVEPPRSPKPAWNHCSVIIPKISHPVDPLSKRQLHISRTQAHVRADIFSWDPPIEGMNRRDFHLNDIMFRKPPIYRGRIKYTVSLPRLKSFSSLGARPSSGLVVNLPASLQSPQSAPVGAFGRRREADGASSWRKPTPSPLKTQSSEELNHNGLDTVSRSPPPEAPSSAKGSTFSRDDAPSPTVSVGVVRTRSQPKMPIGSDVAFYRHTSAGQGVSQPKTTVKFIVSSELEDESTPSPSNPGMNGVLDHPESVPSSADVVVSPLSKVAPPLPIAPSKEPVGPSQGVPILINKNEARKPEPAADVLPISPPHGTNHLPWPKSPRAFTLKESPSRAPDPEHLKAVWSQPSNKTEMPSVNSLERIGDDLTVVPFSLLDVKSEDGETPPPTHSHPPSFDVTRAFQQVPTSSSSSSATLRSAPLSQLTSPPSVPRQSLPPPHMPTTSMRHPTYGYPSPMMSSPSPTMMYPMSMTSSPVPRPMVVNPSQYPQPMWLPVPTSAGAAVQGGVMRPVGPTYGAQLLPYPPQGGAMPMYGMPPGMQGGIPQQPNGVQGRHNGMQMMPMSPLAPQAHASHPMYPSSPIMMSPQVMAMPPGYPNSGQPGRGPMRGVYDQVPGMMLNSPLPQGAIPYNSVQTNSYDRPSW